MGLIDKAWGAFSRHMVEGHFLRYVREQADEAIFGRLSRYIMVHTSKSVPNKIFFHTQENKYTCNPKYICEEFRKRGLKVDLVWRIANNNRAGVPLDVRVVNNGSYEFFKELFTSKYIITNSVLWVQRAFTLRKDQVLFETWHGSLGFKRFGKNDYKGSWHWVQSAIKTGEMTDYCITDSSFVSEQLRKTYWPKTPMLEYGHPRNDILFDGYEELRRKLKTDFFTEHKLEEGTHLIMYGPTFRDSRDFSIYKIDIDGVLDAMEKRFGGKWIMLLRYHSALADVYKQRNFINSSRVIDVTDYIDMQELMTIADAGITDYSSWLLDFMMQKKPGFIYAPDVSDYNVERGLCYPLQEAPFPIAENNRQMTENILNFDENSYREHVERFMTGKGCIEDGHASERVVDKILELMQTDGFTPEKL